MIFNPYNADFSKSEMTDLKRKNNALSAENQSLKSENEWLREQLNLLKKRIYGKRSEKIDPNQLLLELEELAELEKQLTETAEEVEEKTEVVSRRGKRTPLQQHVPADIPIVETILIPEEVQAERDKYKKIGEEIIDELVVVPKKYFIRRIIREKFVRIDAKELAPICSAAPKRLIPNSYASAELLADILLRKYCDHLPLYRQEQILKQRYGIELSRKTMGNWMDLLAHWLSMIYEAIRDSIKASGYLQIDETFIKYINPEKDRCSTGYLWAYHNSTAGVLFEWHTSRASDCLDSMLTGFTGLIQSDGYPGYSCWLNHSEDKALVVHAHCWAHARRKFVESPQTPFVQSVLKQIAQLYKIEKSIKGQSPEQRAECRKAQSAPILEKIKAMLEAEQPNVFKDSKIAKAIYYTLAHWDGLTKYLEYGRFEIDNNGVENAIRPIAIGKKNFLFFGSPDSGQNSAVIYTIIETCRKLNVNPSEYLGAVLQALPNLKNTEISEWTPAQWQARQNATTTV